MLESYLEFSLACFLRFRQFSFYSSSETFNSIFALLVFTTLMLLLIGSIPILHCRPLSKDHNVARSRYSELTLDLKTHKRLSLLQPTLFMLRRLIYTAVIVFWFGDTIKQVLAVLVLNAI